jgi:hypothetical protein
MPITISNHQEYEAACERIDELSSCLEGTPDEVELLALIDAVEAWETAHDAAIARD